MKTRDNNIYVTDSKDFAGIIREDEHGVRRLELLSPDWYKTQLKKFKLGEKVTLYISSRKPKRSDQQNRYYWGAYLPLIARETGENDLDALHNLFKGKFLTTEIKEVLGNKVRITKSTSTLSKNDFSEYIMAIEGLTGVAAPPTDNYWNEEPAPKVEKKKSKKLKK